MPAETVDWARQGGLPEKKKNLFLATARRSGTVNGSTKETSEQNQRAHGHSAQLSRERVSETADVAALLENKGCPKLRLDTRGGARILSKEGSQAAARPV